MNAQIPSYVPTNGLVGYCPFNGNANDISGNGYNGTVNGATLINDRFGNANSAYSFIGINNYIGTSQNFNVINNTPRTCLMWVKNIANLANKNQGLIYWGKNLQSLSKCYFAILPNNGGLFLMVLMLTLLFQSIFLRING